MSWYNPWAELRQLYAENTSLKRRLRETTKALDHERMVSKVFHQANGKLVQDTYLAERDLAAAKNQMAQMHRRDPVTGRLLPKGK
jgi:hypothetical protein